MHKIHIERLGEKASPLTTGFQIDKNDNISFVCVCHTKNSTLTDTIHRLCSDHILDRDPTEKNALEVFTDVLESVNHALDALYLEYKKTDISLFIGLVTSSHLHFSMFGKEITGIIVSEKAIEDIMSDMDTGEGHFVYDSHGDIHENEVLYVFGPKVDNHVIGNEAKNLLHLDISDRCRLLAERMGRSFMDDGIICAVSKGESVYQQWQPQKMSHQKVIQPKVLLDTVKNMGSRGFSKIQGQFENFSKNTQNGILIGGLVVSIILLYLIITTLIQSQYTLFVPQKYRDMLAEARVSLNDATRMIDQPENFGPAMNRVQEIVDTIKRADVLKVDVAQLENDMSVLEKAINKVTTLKPGEFNPIYSFSKTIDSLPFSIYAQDRKISLVTKESIIGPFIPGETPKELAIPNNEKYTFSDTDNEGKIYIATDKDRIYTFDKGIFNIQNVQQIGGWDKAVGMGIYNSNVYLLSSDKRQIYKYRKQSENTYSGRSLVINDNQQKAIIDMDIDGSVWLLAGLDKLAMEKILTAPKYERRPIPMNALGINTFQNIDPDTTKIFAGESYQEVYILADNRIWIFIPGSKRFSDVRFVTYVGQIDVPNVVITDIAVEQDGDVRTLYFGSPKSGVFSTKITIKENKIHLLPAQ